MSALRAWLRRERAAEVAGLLAAGRCYECGRRPSFHVDWGKGDRLLGEGLTVICGWCSTCRKAADMRAIKRDDGTRWTVGFKWIRGNVDLR